MSKTPIPLGDNLLVRPQINVNHRKFGVVNPSAQDEKPERGIVETVGPRVVDKRICIGADVEWRKHAGYEKVINGEKMMLFREDEICLVWEEDYE